MKKYKLREMLWGLFFTLFVFGLTYSCTSNSIEQYAPSEQHVFHKNYKNYSSEFQSGQNEIIKSKVYNDTLWWRHAFFESRMFKIVNWIGKIKKIETPKGGSYVTAEIETDLDGITIIYTNLGYLSEHVESIFNRSKKDLGAMQGGTVYNQLAHFKQGDWAVFSAIVSKSTDRSYGWREVEDVKYPKIAVQFTDIKPISQAVQQQPAKTSVRTAMAYYKKSRGGDHANPFRLQFVDASNKRIELILPEDSNAKPEATIELSGEHTLSKEQVSWDAVKLLDKHYKNKKFAIKWHIGDETYGNDPQEMASVLDSMILVKE